MAEALLDVGVVGAGIAGLSSALLLADAGCRITIVARELPVHGEISDCPTKFTRLRVLYSNADSQVDLTVGLALCWHHIRTAIPKCKEIRLNTTRLLLAKTLPLGSRYDFKFENYGLRWC